VHSEIQGSIYRANNLDSGFHPLEVGEMNSSMYHASEHYGVKSGGGKLATCGLCGANFHMWFPYDYSTGALLVMMVGSLKRL
jgi:hypothetical protein